MKINCVKCGKFVCKLDMRKFENKEEDILFCKSCLSENLDITRELFSPN